MDCARFDFNAFYIVYEIKYKLSSFSFLNFLNGTNQINIFYLCFVVIVSDFFCTSICATGLAARD